MKSRLIALAFLLGTVSMDSDAKPDAKTSLPSFVFGKYVQGKEDPGAIPDAIAYRSFAETLRQLRTDHGDVKVIALYRDQLGLDEERVHDLLDVVDQSRARFETAYDQNRSRICETTDASSFYAELSARRALNLRDFGNLQSSISDDATSIALQAHIVRSKSNMFYGEFNYPRLNAYLGRSVDEHRKAICEKGA